MYAAVGIGGGYHQDLKSLKEMVSKDKEKPTINVAIVGAGTVGLSTAWRIKKELNDLAKVKVTIISEKFYNETTSYGSGGLWEPYQILGTPDDKINEWGKDAFEYFLNLYNSPDGAQAGVQLLTAYNILEENQELIIPSWKDIVFNFQVLTADDLQKMSLPKRFVKGFTFGTLVIDQKYYMRYMTNELHKMGIKFIQQKVNNLDELYNKKYNVIINCTGLGSYTLLQDTLMYPIRGQVLRVKAPWMSNVWFFGTPTRYIIPNVDAVVLGGTAQKDNWDTSSSRDDIKSILDDIYDVFPSMQDATIESTWAGLRPGRTPVRLDSETINDILIVHNYGHGGSGITLAMGCANEVVQNHLIPKFLEPANNNYKQSDWIRHRSKL